MGMYTGIRCKVIIKPEYRGELEYLDKEVGYEWSKSDIEFMKIYGAYSRADFIPRGALSYMPDEWENVPLKANGERDWLKGVPTDGFDRKFDSETGLWTFQCSLRIMKTQLNTSLTMC